MVERDRRWVLHLSWVGWTILTLVLIWARGIRWDETYEHAQVLLGTVPYPDGHPLAQYVHNAFSLQEQLSTFVLWLTGSGAVVCGYRNILFLILSWLPVFLLTHALTRRVFWANVAVLLVFRGLILELDTGYPQALWPYMYSNGHVGLGYTFIGLWAIATGRARLAALLTAMSPAVHIGQAPVLMLVWGLSVLWRKWQGSAGIGPPLRWAAAGALVTALCIGWTMVHRLPEPESGPYAVSENDGGALYQHYTATYDAHRQIPPVRGQVMMAMCLVMAAGAWAARAGRDRGGSCATVFTYAVLTAGVVWGIAAIHLLFGQEIPFLLLGWMPYRLGNHLVVLGLVLAFALLEFAGERVPRGILRAKFAAVALVVFICIQPYLEPYNVHFYGGFYQNTYHILFGVAAFALGAFVVERFHGSSYWWLWGICGLAFVAGAGWFVDAEALALQIGFAAGLLAYSIPLGEKASPRLDKAALIATATAAAVFIGLLIYRQPYNPLPAKPFHEDVRTWLAENDGDAMVLPPFETFYLQVQIDQPVFIDVVTCSFLTYMPRLTPVLEAMYTDAYGISFQLGKRATMGRWREVWQHRSGSDWAQFAQKYNVDYLIAPADLPINEALTPLVQGDGLVFYRLPS